MPHGNKRCKEAVDVRNHQRDWTGRVKTKEFISSNWEQSESFRALIKVATEQSGNELKDKENSNQTNKKILARDSTETFPSPPS